MILCCGEALIDMIPAPLAAGGDGFMPHSGGAVFNTAIALGRLGVEVGFLSGLSRDMFGQQLVHALETSHVDHRFSIRSDRPTTLAFVRIVDGSAAYTFVDENTAGRMITAAQMPALPDTVRALFFGGISLAVEPGAEAYASLLSREGDDRLVMMDPNIRPGFIANEATYRARLSAMLARSDIVKVSDEDLNWVFPGAADLRSKADDMAAAGARLVLVTRGGDGALARLPDGSFVEGRSESVEVVDTVGAGDTFNAGFLASLDAQGLMTKAAVASLTAKEVETALSFAAKTAAVTVSRAGANPPWADELTR